MKEKVVSRFLKYIAMDTQSNPDTHTHPSNPAILSFANMLREELDEMGIRTDFDEEHGYLYGAIEANVEGLETIAFISHMDTATEMPGGCKNPGRFVYEGGTIKHGELVMTPEDFPALQGLVGEEIITTDGTTLLGADDKAGVAAIMTALEYFVTHPEVPHGKIAFAFTPDEEIGEGADYFDVEKLGADFAYTMDGGPLGELEYESFNAASAVVTIRGESIHPGSAKNAMVNAIHIAEEFDAMLPAHARPEHTESYEGFFHLMRIEGVVDKAVLEYIIRDHDRALFEEKKALLESARDFLNRKYGDRVTTEIRDQYYNMGEILKDRMDIIELAKDAMQALEIEPLVGPIRGGTDGSRLTFMGLPTPNIFVGGYHYHGKYELIPTRSMELAVKTILKINELYVQRRQA